MRLTLCSGCQLNNTLVGSLHQRVHPIRKKSWLCVFTCLKTNALHISDGLRNPAYSIVTFSHSELHYVFAAQFLNTGSLRSCPLITSSSAFSTLQQTSLAFKRL